MAGVREREQANRTREAGNLDEVQAAASFASLSTTCRAVVIRRRIISQPSTFSAQRPACPLACPPWRAKAFGVGSGVG